jgi:UDP-2,4-diacetamido-2,4,6-trideoxy-beta-L-altropyranose hydrolase
LSAPTIIFRADASNRIGTGHVMRCLTLADTLRHRGARCVFVTRAHPGHLAALICERGHDVRVLPAPKAESVACAMQGEAQPSLAGWLGCPWQEDWEQTVAEVAQLVPDAVVVDHYALDARWEGRMRPHCRALMAIDDLADRDHDCDIVLDQNWFGDRAVGRYDGRVSDTCRRLLGPTYALLRPEYAQLHQLVPARDGHVRRILVFLGGSDPGNDTAKVLAALAEPRFTDINVDVVVGVNHPDPENIARIAAVRDGVFVHCGLSSLAGLMARADLMVSGGGVTSWERMCLGLPALVISIADNQTATNEAMAAAGHIEFAGIGAALTPQAIADHLYGLCRAPGRLREMGERGRKLVSGLGATLVADSLLSVLDAPAPSAPIKYAGTSYGIQILTDRNSWLLSYLRQLASEWSAAGHRVRIDHRCEDAGNGDFCFCLSFSRIVSAEFRSRFRHTLVVHESDLPRGRGWAPMTWQILEGCSHIPVTLIEAEDVVDSGAIYAQELITLNGAELNHEWRELQALATQRLCRAWVERHQELLAAARVQVGEPTFYPRRRPEDSRLDVERTIAEQFDLLRVADNQRYPAFFTYRGRDFLLRIEAKN